jgi:Spy/CpxP family protein refolding chaperone
MKKLFLAGSLFLLSILMAASPVLAQHHNRKGEDGCPMNEEKGRNLENLRLLKLMEALNLDDKQTPQFISLFVDFRKDVRITNDSIKSEIDKMGNELDSATPNEANIKASLAAIEKLQTKRESIRSKFHGEISKLLTVVQMAKVMVFEERFERKLIETMECFRAGQQPPVGP